MTRNKNLLNIISMDKEVSSFYIYKKTRKTIKIEAAKKGITMGEFIDFLVKFYKEGKK